MSRTAQKRAAKYDTTFASEDQGLARTVELEQVLSGQRGDISCRTTHLSTLVGRGQLQAALGSLVI